MKALRIFLGLLSMLVCASCGPPAHPPKHLVILADVSASIVPEARTQMFAAIKEMTMHLERGDAITIMPVANDASGNLQGHILRFDVPTAREPYDADLRRLHQAVAKALASMETESMRFPAARTDILGTLAIASEELKQERQREVTLVIFSDFLEDDRTLKFANNRALSEPRSARLLAERLVMGKVVFPALAYFAASCGARNGLRLPRDVGRPSASFGRHTLPQWEARSLLPWMARQWPLPYHMTNQPLNVFK